MPKIINGVSYNTHEDLLKISGLTPTEQAEIKLNSQIICALIDARNDKKISQKELEELSGVRQPIIARIERGKTDPQITTLLRILEPLGMTLAVVSKNLEK
ncbi:MAG: helix-turn-helix domain-containing protein [Oscillospiraceae bacterium]|nr:helix-turn-helix domain-containing protein [Oscillospiraceae bacterium]